jgi:energy-coupling factor transporter ATP-binding protein EcfA2
MNIDSAKQKYDRLVPDLYRLLPQIETEQDTRFQLIDRLLVEVLGWPRGEISTEPHVESGYVDYLLGNSDHSQLVIEAKRHGALLLDIRSNKLGYYKAGGAALKSAREGMDQAKRYCVEKAVLLSAITTGTQWIGFWTLRTDRKPPYEGMAAVFPTLESIDANFAEFYQLFSYEGVREQLYEVLIHEAEGLTIKPVEVLESVLADADIHLLRKPPIAADLQAVFRGFFSTIADESDPELLSRCFVESRESREADITLEKITKDLVSVVNLVGRDNSAVLQQEIKYAAESGKGEFVLIIGNKGAGKSTFIDRFFRLVLERQLRERCLVLRIDLADFNGDPSSLHVWLTEKLKSACERSLFEDGMPTFEQLKGAYFDEYTRWRKGPHKHLYERSAQEFDEQFGSWLAAQQASAPESYFMAMLRQSVNSRKLMPCLVFDNADNHRQEIQEAVFQYAQSVFRTAFCFVICPVTDRTIWQLSKTGPLQSYDYRAFYLPVPSSKDVIARRVLFLQEKSAASDSKDYFTSKGVRLTISDIQAFASCVERVFIEEEYIGRLVGWLSNHDIRRSLMIAQQVITSPWIRIEDLVKAFVLGHDATPRRRDTIRALIAGDYNHFKQSQSHYVLNVFAVDATQYCSPMTRLSVLQFFSDRYVERAEVDRLYVGATDVFAYFEPMGMGRKALRSQLWELLKWRLIEPYDPTDSEVHDLQRLRVTHAGRLHLELAFARQEANYMIEMGMTTLIRDRQTVLDLRRKLASDEGRMRWEDWEGFIFQFVTYVLEGDKRTMSVPSHDAYRTQQRLRDELRRTWRPTH